MNDLHGHSTTLDNLHNNKMKQVIAQTYGRYPVTFIKGEGSWLYEKSGDKYLDFLSGLAVNNLGHCHPAVVDAVTRQAATLIHTSNLYNIEPQQELAEKLVDNSFADQVFFCNSGTEANEAAIKAARKHFTLKGKEKFEFITMKNSFHGRTYGGMTATGQPKYHAGYEPLIPGFKYATLNDLDSVTSLVTPKTAGIIIEPIQGEGGVNECGQDFLTAIRELCNKEDILLIFDEVQVGMGRSGKLFCHEHYSVSPDLMALAKALAGGLPIGALVGTDKVMSALQPGSHAATFGGNPLVTAVGCVVMDIIADKGFLAEVIKKEAYLKAKLAEMQTRYSCIEKIKGKGLMVGIDISVSATDILNKALEKKLLINGINDKVIRLLPPLTVEYEEIDHCIQILDEVIGAVCA